MNPYIILGAVLAVISASIGGFFFGMDYKEKQHSAMELERKIGWGEALEAAAKEISKVKIYNKNITTQAETVIREKTILQECKNPAEMVTLINRAAKGETK